MLSFKHGSAPGVAVAFLEWLVQSRKGVHSVVGGSQRKEVASSAGEGGNPINGWDQKCRGAECNGYSAVYPERKQGISGPIIDRIFRRISFSRRLACIAIKTFT